MVGRDGCTTKTQRSQSALKNLRPEGARLCAFVVKLVAGTLWARSSLVVRRWPGLRRRSLATRLTWSHLLATAVALLLLGGALFWLLLRNQSAQATATLSAQASLYAAYAADLAPATAILEGVADRIVHRFPPQPGTIVRIFATNGALITADRSLGQFPSRAVQPFVSSQAPVLPLAPRGRRYVAQPVMQGGQPIGIVEVSSDITPELGFRRQLLLALLLASTIALLGALLLANLLARNLARPLVDLQRVASAIAAGDWQTRADDCRGDEIGQLGREINRMAADLQLRFKEINRLAETRREFYRSVSHELRTPLAALRGMAENLEDEATPDQQRSIAIMQAETARLQRLVDELLAGGEGELVLLRERRPIELSGLAAGVVELMQPRATRAGVRLDFKSNTHGAINGDQDRLKQALVNVLDNALKWTPPGGEVHITVTATSLQNRPTLTIAVADTGPGIPPELQATLWGRGARGTGGGQGLGLALARQIVEAHGGAARLGAGPGAVVEFTFPLV